MNKIIYSTGLIAALILGSCSEEMFDNPGQTDDNAGLITLSGQICQEAVTRANDDGFADGDIIGVYIVDYNGSEPGTLKTTGNRGDNVSHTFDEAAYRWTSAYDLYWKDKNTRIDVYGYYPYASPCDVNYYEFSVATDQSRTYGDGAMGNYEASDFLWGKVSGVEPTTNVIRLPFTHRMANARVTLVEGAGFESGQWPELSKQVLVSNTIHNAVIDLATGSVAPSGDISPTSIIPAKNGDEWRAIVVPQTIAAGTSLFTINIDGVPYRFDKDEDFTYAAGKMNNFSIRVDRKEMTGQYTLTLIGESITPWENDLVSHDATSKQYIIVNSTAGGLKDAIAATGNDYHKLKNLKITGEVNANDFYFMRDEMTELQALNLKETVIKAVYVNMLGYTGDDQIPIAAFYSSGSPNTKLTYLILPDRLKSIGPEAFCNCNSLTGSLIIPEGVTEIQDEAFLGCTSLSGSLSLPSTLKSIGYGAFRECNFTAELIIPAGVETIGGRAFWGCNGFYGSLRLPDQLKEIGVEAFSCCSSFTGDLIIPQSITEIPYRAFGECGFDGLLQLHDGITSIGTHAFYLCHFKGELTLPKNLLKISEWSFYGCDFSGQLTIPPSVQSIGEKAFIYNWRLSGVVEFPEGLLSIGQSAFEQCGMLEGMIFPESLENIGISAFADCFGVGSIVCNSSIPPHIMPNAFNGVPKDNFTIEVPEAAVVQYQTAAGWNDFKRIAAHHELVCRPSVACALSTEHKQPLLIDAEGDWEVESMPDWCELSQTSGSKKTELTLTIKATSSSDQREGDVVFRLKDKDYTHSCHVSQYGYEYGEDEFLTLQKATRGNNGGINIVILGDGYDAKDIASGTYLNDMKQEIEYFFGIEPYNTYRDYFNVYTAFPVSTETGVGTVNTIRYNRFSTTYTGGVGLQCDNDMVFDYAMKAPTVNSGNIDQTLIIIIPNSTDYGGVCQMWESGAAIAFCPKSTYGYPLDSRGVIQHEAGGHGFGKFADEYIYYNSFITVKAVLIAGKSLGWYDNLELTGKMHDVGWSHLIFDPRYSDIVDIYEGGFEFSRGVYRSEQNSCMNNDIPYYSTICRESIVKRIKRYAGEEFDFEEFVANDRQTIASRSTFSPTFDIASTVARRSEAPVIHKGSPLSSANKRKKQPKQITRR